MYFFVNRVVNVKYSIKILYLPFLKTNEKINQEQYLDIVAKNQPIKPFKTVPALPSLEDITNSLDISKVATGITK